MCFFVTCITILFIIGRFFFFFFLEEIFFQNDPTEYYHQLQLQDFVNAVADNRKPLVTGEDGLKSAELIEAIYRSSRSGMPVKLPLEEVEA